MLEAFLIAGAGGAVVLIPSLVLLFAVFKRGAGSPHSESASGPLH
jgi:hypothetical protein